MVPRKRHHLLNWQRRMTVLTAMRASCDRVWVFSKGKLPALQRDSVVGDDDDGSLMEAGMPGKTTSRI
jgi:hypothetical protein